MYYWILFYLYITIYIFRTNFYWSKKLREQVKEVYGILKESFNPKGELPICDDFPVEFPLKTHEELQDVENYLSSRQNRNSSVYVMFIKIVCVL